jgi:hypothetical protein
MKIVHFVTGKDPISDYLNTPVRYNKRLLCDKGYKVKMLYQPSKRNLTCDILCFVSKPLLRMVKEGKSVFGETGPIISFIKEAKKYANKIIWMDMSDSTSVTHFELLPYVDLYLKKHLLKDKKLYQKEFYGGRIYTDFYHRKFGIVDTSPFDQFFPLDMKLSYKVGLSWNMGMGEIYNAFSKTNHIRKIFPDFVRASYKVPFVDPKKERKYDLFLRVSANLPRETIAFQRKEFVDRLDKLLQLNKSISGSVKGPVPLKIYRKMMRDSKVSFGPFGWGELNVREYEAHIFGTVLVRPDISHMETFPCIFISGETYQPVSWGFEDLESVVLDLLHDNKKRLRIAQNGQEAYRESISSKGMEKFCGWFIQQIES